jgi:type IV pilus assembly protein PilE
MSGRRKVTSGGRGTCEAATHLDNRDMCHAPCSKRPIGGFTMIELMIVLGVVGVLAVIAYPSFQDSLRKSRRSDAIAGLNQLQQLQERVRGQQASYANSTASMPGSPSNTSPQGYYSLAVDAASPIGYRMTATAKASSTQYGDINCRGLRVEMKPGGQIIYSSLNAAGDEDTINANRCWPR